MAPPSASAGGTKPLRCRKMPTTHLRRAAAAAAPPMAKGGEGRRCTPAPTQAPLPLRRRGHMRRGRAAGKAGAAEEGGGGPAGAIEVPTTTVRGEDGGDARNYGKVWRRKQAKRLASVQSPPSSKMSWNPVPYLYSFALSVVTAVVSYYWFWGGVSAVYVGLRRIVLALTGRPFAGKEEAGEGEGRHLQRKLKAAKEFHERQDAQTNGQLIFARSQILEMQKYMGELERRNRKMEEEVNAMRKERSQSEHKLVAMAAKSEMVKADHQKQMQAAEREKLALQAKLEKVSSRHEVSIENSSASTASLLAVQTKVDELQKEQERHVSEFYSNLQTSLRVFSIMKSKAGSIREAVEEASKEEDSGAILTVSPGKSILEGLGSTPDDGDAGAFQRDNGTTHSGGVNGALEMIESVTAGVKDAEDGKISHQQMDHMLEVNQYLSEELTRQSMQHTADVAKITFKALQEKNFSISLEAQLQIARSKLREAVDVNLADS